jgi:hypothetical protein
MAAPLTCRGRCSRHGCPPSWWGGTQGSWAAAVGAPLRCTTLSCSCIALHGHVGVVAPEIRVANVGKGQGGRVNVSTWHHFSLCVYVYECVHCVLCLCVRVPCVEHAAIADVLFGAVSPSGRLPVTFYYDNYTSQVGRCGACEWLAGAAVSLDPCGLPLCSVFLPCVRACFAGQPLLSRPCSRRFDGSHTVSVCPSNVYFAAVCAKAYVRVCVRRH